ncbi:gamma-glutamyltransferase [Paenibacillus glycanilyticus]|uniref:Glutathione hydrolase proenzyme n=1 Tax=Paenibacillus glycanilyticus TaxID=126569 RepID=A0ABQ6GIG6_9BACL|nr:gamma-glutamyltransferase [Paenibacillus glycanilyticus]GLX70043.1 putative gamma-glutamyltransferase YwrD [Paenibacillus glycanilyticus]
MKKPVTGTKAMVVSPHHLATAAGARVLERGGNAFDAAIAVSACLAVVYPHMTGVGGDAFFLSYHASDGEVRAYNASGRSGSAATIEAFADREAIPIRGPRSAITVPGMADGWHAVQNRYGRMAFSEVLEPAIAYAAEGFPMSPDQYEHTKQHAAMLGEQAATANIYMPGGRIVQPGERFVQAQLAATLTKLAEAGRDGFYKGEIAAEIVRFLQAEGGLLQEEDFAKHSGEWTEPIRGSYRGYDIYQVPPNSQGFTGIMALQMLEQFDLAAMGHGSYEYYHVLTEALKLSFRDRNRYLTDPAFAAIPLDRLLSKEYAAELASSINRTAAMDINSQPVGSDTAYAAVVDEDGNAVSFIQSLYFEFGSGVVAGDTGVLLQNRGSFFSLDPGHINRLEPGKRTFHTLMPAMACQNGKPSFLYGTQGGEGQPQTQTLMLTRMIDFGMDPQQAVGEPRFVWGRTWGLPTQELKLEGRIPQETADKLAEAGHLVRRMPDFDGIMGHAHAIAIGKDGMLIGGSDPRCDGSAIGW